MDLLFFNFLGGALEQEFEVSRDSYLFGKGLDEKKELLDILLEKWKVFFSNPDLMGIIDREEKGYINSYSWDGEWSDGNGDKSGKINAKLYLCKYNSGEFLYSTGANNYPFYYSDDNLDCRIYDMGKWDCFEDDIENDILRYDLEFLEDAYVKRRARNIYFEFTKDDIMLSFAMHQEVDKAGVGLKLLLTFQPTGETAESVSIYCAKPSTRSSSYKWCEVTISEMLIKMGLDDMHSKMSAFVKHFDSPDSFTEKFKAEIQKEMNEKKRKLEEYRRKQEHEEQERQRAIEEEKRKQEEKMDRLKNL